MARVAAGAFGFLIFSRAFDGPDLYGAWLEREMGIIDLEAKRNS
jgi:hypothetical protein